MKISTRVFLVYFMLLVFFTIVTVVNYRFSGMVNSNTKFLIKSEGIIRNSTQYQRSIIDMENSFRGFLLTGDSAYLPAMDSNRKQITQLYDTLQVATPDTSEQTHLLYLIQGLYTNWDALYIRPLTSLKVSNRLTLAVNTTNEKRKEHTNSIIGTPITSSIKNYFRKFNRYEYNLREQRRAALNDSLRYTSYISIILIGLAFVLGLASILYITRFLSRRIQFLVFNAEQIAEGNFDLNINDRTNDEMMQLSQSINTMARKLGNNFTELKRKNEDLNQFAYVVSHDLKAPLRGIQTVMNWIEEDVGDKLDPKTKEYHEIIKGRLLRMENLISAILDLSRLGRKKWEVETVDVNNLITEIIDNLSAGDRMKFHVSANLPTLKTERVLLQQVFTNLMSNAIKYHDKKQGNIFITCEGAGEFYRFGVIDDGPGIDPAYHKKIFEVFQTLKERDAMESTGIGLSIVKKIIEEKGGEITVDSTVGQGAAFYFTWPKEQVV
jgi:signal transduction histidine kinase